MLDIPSSPPDQDPRLYLTRVRKDMAQDVMLGLAREMRYGLDAAGQPVFYNADHYDVTVGLPRQFDWFTPQDAVLVGTINGRTRAMPDRPYRAFILLQSPEQRAAYQRELACPRHWPDLAKIEAQAIAQAQGTLPWRAGRETGDPDLFFLKVTGQAEPERRPAANILSAGYEAEKQRYFTLVTKGHHPLP